eukprot:13598806-Alexandrium_andersonii.AAC.1
MLRSKPHVCMESAGSRADASNASCLPWLQCACLPQDRPTVKQGFLSLCLRTSGWQPQNL